MYKKHGDANENKLKNRSIATAKMRSDEKIRGYDDDTDITKNQSPYHTNLHIIQTCVQINAYSCHTTSFSMKIFMLFINRNRLFFLSIFLSHSPCFSSRKILKSLMLEMCYFAECWRHCMSLCALMTICVFRKPFLDEQIHNIGFHWFHSKVTYRQCTLHSPCSISRIKFYAAADAAL